MSGGNIIKLFHGKIPEDIAEASDRLDETITNAINEAFDDGVPYGFLVSILHGHAHSLTQKMMDVE